MSSEVKGRLGQSTVTQQRRSTQVTAYGRAGGFVVTRDTRSRYVLRVNPCTSTAQFPRHGVRTCRRIRSLSTRVAGGGAGRVYPRASGAAPLL